MKSDLNEQKSKCTQQLLEVDKELQELRAQKAISASKLAKAKSDYEALLKKQSINDISARALLAFDELQKTLYDKSIRLVETGFSQFFASLINKSDLIDGIHIDDSLNVLPYKNKHFKADEIHKIIGKNGVEYLIAQIGLYAYEVLQQKLIVDELRAQANRLDTRFKTNEEKLIKAGGEKARELQERIEELIRLISIARDELERIESKDENDASLTEENNLHKADQKFKYYEQEIAKATRTNTALRKKELVDSLVNEIKLQATTALKQEIVRKTNEKLRRVIVDDYVEIESIDRYIKLKGRDGASEGQTLSIAYCFLGTLFEDSELEFPFIIDSPTGKMDFEKRQAVADIIPLVFNQMIAFVQSAEVERFADRFYANPDSQYLTVVASPQDQAVVVYEGIDFFDSYQREHKGDEK